MSTEVDFDVMYEEQQKTARALLIRGLRDLADFLEARPEAPAPNDVDVYTYRGENFKQCLRHLGSFDKQITGINDEIFAAVKQFGPVCYRVLTMREQVCERVVVGKKLVAAKPAEPEHEEDIVEWKCADSLIKEMEAEAEGEESQ